MSHFNYEFSVLFPAPPRTVFDYISDPKRMSTWTAGAKLRRVADSPLKGNPNNCGSVRVVETLLGSFFETITRYAPPRFLEYRITKGSIVKNHVGRILIVPEAGETRLTWRIQFDPRVSFTGSLIRWISKPYFVLTLRFLSLRMRFNREENPHD